MTHPALIERITRSLAYMLRHQPDEFDLEVDEHGYAEIGEVLRALNERLGESVAEEDVREAVESGDRQRYEIADDKIRALYGHSIEVQPGEPARPPERLYVGVSRADADRARRYGLRPGRRRFLHLALTPDDALETAQRTAREHEVIVVSAMDAWEAGINFYDRISLFLSDPIPTQFLEGAVTQGHRGVASGRPAPIRHAREEVVYARPEEDEAHGEQAEHDDGAAVDAPAGFEPAAGGHGAVDDGPRRRRRGRRGRRGEAEGAPSEPARAQGGVAHERAAPRHDDYEEAPRLREEAPRAREDSPPRGRDDFREQPPARPEPRREERAPRAGSGAGHPSQGGRGPDRPRDDRPMSRPPERAPQADRGHAAERGHSADRGHAPERTAPRADDRGYGGRDERPRAPERPFDDRSRGPERAREDRPRFDDRPRQDERPRADDRPRYDERPRQDERPRFDDRPRQDDRPRGEDRPRQDDRPRFDERSRQDERPRSEDRPRSDDRPRPEDRPRFDERPRFEGPRGGDEGRGRPERPARAPEEGRAPARRDEIPRPQYEAPRRSENEGGGFGLGVDESASRPAPQRPAPRAERPAPREEERQPERKPERQAPPDEGGGFGAGIL